jgi:hypothetical protein
MRSTKELSGIEINYDEEDYIENFLSMIGCEISDDGVILLKGNPVHCKCCQQIITPDNIGYITNNGQQIFWCKDSACTLNAQIEMMSKD